MKAAFSLVVGVSWIAVLGNAQDDVAPVASSAATAYGTQGNVAHNRNLHESELMRAAAEARRTKELMAAMAASSPSRQPVFTTAEEFLAANKPPVLPPEERPEPVRGANYVPSFEGTARVNHGAPSPDYSAPAPESVPTYSGEPTPSKKEGGLFGLFKPKKSETPDFGPVGAADYDQPYGPSPGMNTEPVEYESPVAANPEAEEAMVEATGGTPVDLPEVGNGGKPGLFGRLFGGKQEEMSPAPVESPAPEYPELASTTAPPAPAENEGGVPEAPNWNEEPAAAPMPEPAPAPEPAAAPTEPTASIFVRRPSTPQAGQAASVRREENATVNGVYVKLYEGTRVTVLNSNGGQATIQLPDGRVGTIPRTALQM